MEGIDIQERVMTASAKMDGPGLIAIVWHFRFLSGWVERVTDMFRTVCTKDDVCNGMMPTGDGGVCYKGGITVKENYQMCDVTSMYKKPSTLVHH